MTVTSSNGLRRPPHCDHTNHRGCRKKVSGGQDNTEGTVGCINIRTKERGGSQLLVTNPWSVDPSSTAPEGGRVGVNDNNANMVIQLLPVARWENSILSLEWRKIRDRVDCFGLLK